MKIAVFHDLPSGGAKRSVFETLRRLARRHRVDIYTLNTSDHDFCDLRPYVHNYNVFEFQPLPLFRSPLGRLNQLQRWRNLSRFNLLAHQIASKIDQGDYDLIYVHPSMWVQAPLVLAHLRTASVYYIHEPLRSAYEPEIYRPYSNRGWRRKLDRLDPLIRLYRSRLIGLDRLNTHQASYILANSRFTAANIERIYGRSAQVTYLGVDNEIFRPLDSVAKENFVLSVGALHPLKGYDFLIEALGRIPISSRPPLRLIGNAEHERERSYLTALARQHNVELTIETMIDLRTLVYRYNQAALLLYAPVREPFGLVSLEAMACATPVVGVAEGGVCETVVDGVVGRLVDRDPDAFANAIVPLLENQRLRTEYGQQARRNVLEKWTWDASVARLEQYFHNLESH